ncbi:PREDICTED: GDSL esterase/lipase LIP-4-like [Tarenaya hassleriana]|uniref:GDSL esterase/lipase LIP-4-like n=1 Tax=Tarenaya hassleriana TaxID=28532 RepID=UPI0008FD578A|nr:PREDICTED: GDSL esterase/lipase LIP-4-like [Tarenaya hassleriana]
MYVVVIFQVIYDHGGRNFWVHNTGPLGCVPLMLTLIEHVPTDLDVNRCHKNMNEASKIFNDQLRAACDELRSDLEGVTVVYVDIHSIKFDLIANATKYGFEDPFMACCGSGGPPYNFRFGAQCGQNGSTVCTEGLKYNSWDGVHLTEAANHFISSKLLSTNYSSPPLPLNHFCN